MEKAASLFRMINPHGHNVIAVEAFSKHKDNKNVVAFAESLEIETTDLEQFFSILSANGTRPVDLETFVVGCIKLRGVAKSMDLMDLLITQKKFVEEQRAC